MIINRKNLVKSFFIWFTVTMVLSIVIGILLGVTARVIDDRSVSDSVAFLTATPVAFLTVFFGLRQWQWASEIWKVSTQS